MLIATDPTHSKMIRGYCEHLVTMYFDEMDNLEKNNLQKLVRRGTFKMAEE